MTTPSTPYAARRAELVRRMRDHGGGVAVLFSGHEVMRNRDSDYPFRFDSYFHYLTGFPEPEAALVLVADGQGHRSLLFCREKNEEREIWDGFRWGPQAAREAFGFDEAHPIGQLDQSITEVLADAPAIHHAVGDSEALDARVRGWLGAVRAKSRAGTTAPRVAVDVRAALDEMRLVKDPRELDTMRRAAHISALAHRRAMLNTRPGMKEYEIEAELLHEFRRHGSQYPAYGSIVAGGANACVLHYRSNDAVLRAQDLLLIDAGCELDGYASDITRTFPIGGRFSSAQRELYEVVLAAQLAAIDATRPGARFDAPHEAALRVLVQGMIDSGLLQGTVDDAIADGRYKRFYMHRTSHWLGMDVHDCGDYRERSEPTEPGAAEPPWRILRPGMVLTIEPGLYVRAAADVPERFHDIGIRIEDDAAVTDSGCEILTHEVPKAPDEIETLMRRQ